MKKTIEEIKSDISMRWYGFTWKVRRGFSATVKWCSENKELTIAGLSALTIAGRGVIKTVHSIDRKIYMKKEQKFKELSVYDRSLGMYHELRRPMTAREKAEFARRRHNGEGKLDILISMGLLKLR